MELTFWVSLTHSISLRNEQLQSLLRAVEKLGREEVCFEYTTGKKVSDFVAKRENSVVALLLESAVCTAKWQVSFDLWGLMATFAQFLSLKTPQIDPFFPLFQSIFIDLCFDPISDATVPGLTGATVLDWFREYVREPLECSPALYQQVKNLLDFYEPRVEVAGRVRNVGVQADGQLPDLSHVLRYNKKFPFL